MKVLIVFNHPAPYKVKLFNELAKNIDLHVIFERKKARNRNELFYSENVYNFSHDFIKNGQFGIENSFSNYVKNYIKSNYKNFDLIVMNGYSTITEQKAINYMIKNNIPYVLFINGGIIKKKELFLKKILKVKYVSNACACLSPNLSSSNFLKFYGATSPIFEYPYSTFYEKEILKRSLSESEKRNIKEKYDLKGDEVFISASNFIERKNNVELIKCFKNEKYNLYLFGNGPLRNKYNKIIKDEKINNVFIRDFLPKRDLMEVMSACDCFITLSKEDIYGHTTMEALACGLPVISSNNVTSSTSVIENSKNGFIISNEVELHNAINFAIKKSMAKYAISTAQSFTIEKESLSILNAFRKIIK